MPSFERAESIVKNKDSRSPYSYDKMLAFFNTKADPNEKSVGVRANKVSVSLTNSPNYYETINSLPKEEYLETAGIDLGSLFMPFETNVQPNGSGLPGFLKGIEQASPPSSNLIMGSNVLPFMWEPHRNQQVYDRWLSPSGDGLNGLVTSDRIYGDMNRFREVTRIRSMGLRLPIMGVGWGYTLQDAKAMPSGTSTETQPFPSGDRARVFRGGTTKGWQVDPSHYIAAPIDFRYDDKRHVWTCGGGTGVPPGSGIYKVLTIIDHENPGNVSWDYLRFPPQEPNF